jgi:hypothetical protein
MERAGVIQPGTHEGFSWDQVLDSGDGVGPNGGRWPTDQRSECRPHLLASTDVEHARGY